MAESWQLITQRVVRILARLEEAASASYQIRLEVGPRTVKDLFDRVGHSVSTNVSSDEKQQSTSVRS